MTKNMLLTQRSADLSQGGPKQSAAEKYAAMDAHWKRSQEVHEKASSVWKGVGDSWNASISDTSAELRPITYWWNSLQGQLKESDDAQMRAAD